MTRSEMEERGWDQLDFLCITGDAYVDHPSFGIAIISRLLEAEGFRVGILAQPDYHSAEDFKRFGKPRLGILITGGNLDSMVSNYTVSKKPRRRDAYSPGGVGGRRPDRASIVYAIRAREAHKGILIILGGLEASLRRFAHYDYWEDRLRRSILLDAKADLLVYGMGERGILEIAKRLREQGRDANLKGIRGTVYATSSLPPDFQGILLPSYEELLKDRTAYARSFLLQYQNTDPVTSLPLAEPYGIVGASVQGAEGSDTKNSGNERPLIQRFVIQEPPAFPLSMEELDRVYALPYTRTYHPSYETQGGVPALEEVRFSLISSRGCFGGCSFCALTFHQGRIVQSRSHESLLQEAMELTQLPDFKGYIHDVGGPTANFRHTACSKQLRSGSCPNRLCLVPKPCPNLKIDHQDYLQLLRKLRSLPKVKKVFVRSGIRYDYLLADPDPSFFRELCQFHVSGQLKVAPEHITPRVLEAMGKPSFDVYRRFEREYQRINKELQKEQYLVPYFISSHPGSDLEAAIELAEYFRDHHFIPEQVQDFYPTPGTLSTCMYYTGIDPRTGKEIYVPRSAHEKALQRALLQYRDPKHHSLVVEALTKAGRTDLIGFGPKCLVRPLSALGRPLNRKSKRLRKHG
ncbi:MAG: YgiQ family radical SAM protein [Spirochaetes bacterium]|nr:YgiQ family radical SAM protein [Spirochaetota bacterium]